MSTLQNQIAVPVPALSFSRADLGLLIARSMGFLVFFYHGAQKLFGWFGGSGLSGFAGYLESLGTPFPMLAAFAAALSEVLGAIVLLSGRGFFGLVPLVFTMVVAITTQWKNGFDVQQSGIEFPLTMLLMLVSLLLTGPGSLVVPARGGSR